MNIDKNRIQNNLDESTNVADKLREYYNILNENKGIALVIFLTVLAITVYYVNTAEKIYRSTTLLKIEPESATSILKDFRSTSSIMRSGDNFLANQIKILQSYQIRKRVAESIADSLINFNNLKKFDVLLLNPEDINNLQFLNVDQIRVRLKGITSISQEEGLDIINISVEGRKFEELSMISNIYAAEYIKYELERSKADIAQVKRFLELEKLDKANELNKLEQRIEQYKLEHEIPNLNYGEKLFYKIEDFNFEKENQLLKIESINLEIDKLSSSLSEIDKNYLERINLQLAQSDLLELQKEKNKLTLQKELYDYFEQGNSKNDEFLKEYYGKVEILEKLISQKKDSILAKNIGNYDKLETNFQLKLFDLLIQKTELVNLNQLIGERISSFQMKLNTMPVVNLELIKLLREKSINESLYITIEQKYQEANINEKARVSSNYILDPGYDQRGSVKPDKMRIIIVGVFVGLLLALMGITIKYMLDRTIKLPEELEKFGANVLAWIPFYDSEQYGTERNEHIVATRPTSNISESIKVLRTRIHFSRFDGKPLRTILVTSSMPSEGKSFISTNLAASSAIAGQKTVLIDCDLRKPRAHSIFKMDKKPGISDYLVGDSTLEEIQKKTFVENLTLISAGTIPTNPSELLGSNNMRKFLDELKEIYDIIIVDSPPMLAVTDSEILYKLTDGMILTVKANSTPREVIKNIVLRIKMLGSDKFLGAVLNAFKYKEGYGYYYKYYYYYSETQKDEKSKK